MHVHPQAIKTQKKARNAPIWGLSVPFPVTSSNLSESLYNLHIKTEHLQDQPKWDKALESMYITGEPWRLNTNTGPGGDTLAWRSPGITPAQGVSCHSCHTTDLPRTTSCSHVWPMSFMSNQREVVIVPWNFLNQGGDQNQSNFRLEKKSTLTISLRA